jgi:hypothetical protein
LSLVWVGIFREGKKSRGPAPGKRWPPQERRRERI